jgi:hypothetical protein
MNMRLHFRAGLVALAFTAILISVGMSPALTSITGAATRLTAHASSSGCNGTLTSGSVAGMAATNDDGGYWIASSQGLVVACGDAPAFGGLSSAPDQPIVGIATTPDGGGYYLVASDGGVFAFGDAAFQGSTGGTRLNRPVVGMAVDQATGGYWLVASDGGIFAYNAPFYGSTGSLTLNRPVVGMAPSNGGLGYWLVASDGGIFAYNAPFWGSTGAIRLNKPVVGMAADLATNGYLLVASDGGIFAYNAPFYGSTGSIVLNQPIVGMEANVAGTGYRFVASDGGIFTFGSSGFYGSAVAPAPVAPAAPSSSLIYTGLGWDAGGLQGPMPAPGTCHYGSSNGNALPDAACTPGAVNTGVTQANIQSTICTTGYTTTVRPPESMTEPDKYKSMAAYSSPGTASDYEYDHLVPLELGGSSDVRNLWPEAYAGGSYTKDGVENRLNHVVCSGQVTLAAAQHAIATNWTTAEAVLGVGP